MCQENECSRMHSLCWVHACLCGRSAMSYCAAQKAAHTDAARVQWRCGKDQQAGAADEEAPQSHVTSNCVIFSWSCPCGCLSFELHPDREGLRAPGAARGQRRGGGRGRAGAADRGGVGPAAAPAPAPQCTPAERSAARQRPRAGARCANSSKCLYLCLWGAAVLV